MLKRNVLILSLFCLLLVAATAPLTVRAAEAPAGSTGNRTLQSPVAFAETGVYAVLSGKLYYHDYASGQSVFLRNVDLVDDVYAGKLNGTPRRFEKYYEMTDQPGFVQVYDGSLWLLTRRHQANEAGWKYVLRQYDRAASEAVDHVLGDVDAVSMGALHLNRFFFLVDEALPIGDNRYTNVGRLWESDLATGVTRPLDLPVAMFAFTFHDTFLYFAGYHDDDTERLTDGSKADRNDFKLYRYDLTDGSLQDLGQTCYHEHVWWLGDKLLFIRAENGEPGGGDSTYDLHAVDPTTGKSERFLTLGENGMFSVLATDGERLALQTMHQPPDLSHVLDNYLYDAAGQELYHSQETYAADIDYSALPELAGFDRGRLYFLKGFYRDSNVDYRELRMLDTHDLATTPRVLIEWEK